MLRKGSRVARELLAVALPRLQYCVVRMVCQCGGGIGVCGMYTVCLTSSLLRRFVMVLLQHSPVTGCPSVLIQGLIFLETVIPTLAF